MWLCFYIEDNIGVSIIDFRTENALKKKQKTRNVDMFTMYIKRTKLEYLSSIVFHNVILKML